MISASVYFLLFTLVVLQPILAIDHQILWQFQRDSGSSAKTFGDDLQAALGQPEVALNDTITFTWGEGSLHSVYKVTSLSSFENCVLDGVRMISSPRSTGSLTITATTPGTLYFFDDFGSNCADLKMKIMITVLPAGQTPATTTAATTPVAATTPASGFGSNHTVIWHFGITQADVVVETVDTLRFLWNNNGISHTLREVSLNDYTNCNTSSVGTDLAAATTLGDVSVTGLSVGTHYFMCWLPTHCSSGKMKVRVFVEPGPVRYWVSIYSRSGSSGSARVALRLTGLDSENRLWTSNERAVNVQGGTANVPLDTAGPGLFEVYMRDVGQIYSVHVLLDNATSSYEVEAIRLYKPDEAGSVAVVVTCAGRARDSTDSLIGEQYCIALPSDAVVPGGGSSGSNSSWANANATECSCYREFLVVNQHQRVMACSKDGCFATADNGLAGWSDMQPVAHLIGVASGGDVYALSHTNTTLVSRDGGVTWSNATASVPALSRSALEYDYDGSTITLEPTGANVFLSADNAVEWGVSSQGVHYSRSGSWNLHALWACSCDGQCGLKCEQDTSI